MCVRVDVDHEGHGPRNPIPTDSVQSTQPTRKPAPVLPMDLWDRLLGGIGAFGLEEFSTRLPRLGSPWCRKIVLYSISQRLLQTLVGLDQLFRIHSRKAG